MSEGLEKIRQAVYATLEKLEKIESGPTATAQNDKLQKKLLTSSSERMAQTARRAADECISCAMKACDLTRAMRALLKEMRDRAKQKSADEDVRVAEDAEDRAAASEAGEGSAGKDDAPKEDDDDPYKKELEEEFGADTKDKSFKMTEKRLKGRHLLLRSKNLSFLSQINDEARDCQQKLRDF